MHEARKRSVKGPGTQGARAESRSLDRAPEKQGDRHRPRCRPASGVRSPRLSATAGSTSPRIPSSVRVGPTSRTTAPGFTMSGVTIPGPADGGDDDVRPPDLRGEVGRARVADRDRRVRLEQQHRGRAADDLAAADHDGVLARRVDVVGGQELHAARRRRGDVERRAEIEVPRVHGVKAVDVLAGASRVRHARLVHVRGERQLHEDAVDLVVGVELFDEREHLRLRRARVRRMSRASMPASVAALCFAGCRRQTRDRRRRARSPARRGRAPRSPCDLAADPPRKGLPVHRESPARARL